MLENRQIVNVAEREDLPLIVVGTGAIGIQVVGINECGVIPVGGIVDRMAVGVRQRELQAAAIRLPETCSAL